MEAVITELPGRICPKNPDRAKLWWAEPRIPFSLRTNCKSMFWARLAALRSPAIASIKSRLPRREIRLNTLISLFSITSD
jgi:hypothetical protein